MKEKVKLLKALGDDVRIEIVRHLLSGEKCACSVVPLAGKSQPNVSRHLKILVEAGVLAPRRKGVYIWYRLKSKDAVRIMKALGIQKINRSRKGC
jgi:ArsR family transcriptional regulator